MNILKHVIYALVMGIFSAMAYYARAHSASVVFGFVAGFMCCLSLDEFKAYRLSKKVD